jgi:hypothetical protein
LKYFPLPLPTLLLVAALGSFSVSRTSAAQSFASSSAGYGSDSAAAEPFGSTARAASPLKNGGIAPFSRIAFGANISPLGVGMMAATNINRHFDVRADGGIFNYTENNFSTQGLNIDAKINFSSARATVDYYPFHRGFRISPGVMFYNGNSGTFNLVVAPGQSFILNDQTYYSAQGANAVHGTGTFGLGNGSPSFTLTSGWGNIIPNSDRHFSFPFEVGVAFIQAPTLNFNLTGFACDATGVFCVDVATNPEIQANLAAQVQDYRSDLNPLKTYPIASFGVAYNFNIRKSY